MGRTGETERTGGFATPGGLAGPIETGKIERGDPPSELFVNVFAYGTLVFPAVMEAVTGRRFESRDAVLRGYRRRMLRGRLYPGIVPAPAESVTGRIWLGIDARALLSLDDFEGDEYGRRTVSLEVGEDVLRAEAYVVSPSSRFLMTSALWDERRFAARHLAAYVARCRAFRAEHLRAARDRRPRGAPRDLDGETDPGTG